MGYEMKRLANRTSNRALARCTRAFLVVTIVCCLSLLGTSAAAASMATATIQDLLKRANAPDIDFKSLDIATLRLFYARHNFEPAWTGNATAEAEGRVVVSALQDAQVEGLDPFDYHVGVSMFRASPTTPMEQAEHDLILTDGVLRYARELRTGRAQLRDLDGDVDLPKQTLDATTALDAALRRGNLTEFLAGLEPPQPEYARLKNALARYRWIAADGGWRELPPTMSIDVDEDSDSGAALRERLAFEDDQLAHSNLDDALKRFQLHHDLDDDGRVGPRTLAALNVPVSDRVMQIEANMERWRWLPGNLEPERIEINVPEGQLNVVANGASVLASRVIVGKRASPTPILRTIATAVTINPPWNVPAKIASGEILAKLRRSADYLQSENMVLVDGPPGDPYGRSIDWRNIKSFPYRVRQLPGPKNALGQIKLELPNRFDVYLHDTPAKAAFDLDERNLSHGCVRVQQILGVASYALSGDANALVDKLTRAISSGTTQRLALSRPLPIYFLYWTTFVDSDGTVEFHPDIYGRDDRLIAALRARGAGQSFTLNDVQCAKA